jgi:protein-S-isoprenylcysteine O-methyltransferase Ste14
MPGATSNDVELTGDGRVLGWLLVAAQFALIAALVVAPNGGGPDTGGPGRAMGFVAVILGLALATWGASALGRNLTPHPAPRPGAPRVRTGPFRWTPHPIYLGLGLAACGVAALRGGALPVACAVALCLLLIGKAHYEARLLRRAHPSPPGN